MCQLWAWCCSCSDCTDSSWLKQANTYNQLQWTSLQLKPESYFLFAVTEYFSIQQHCNWFGVCVSLQLRASRPASVTGVSHRFRTWRQARCSDSNLNPASPNWIKTERDQGWTLNTWPVVVMCVFLWLLDLLLCVFLPVWTRGWVVWATAAWWAARHRHWWRWWRPSSGSPNSQKILNSTGGPDLHPVARWGGNIHYWNSGSHFDALSSNRCWSGQKMLTLCLCVAGKASVWPHRGLWGQSQPGGASFSLLRRRQKKKDGVWAEGLAGSFSDSRWGVWAVSCLISLFLI